MQENVGRLNDAGVIVHVLDLDLRLWRPDLVLFKAVEIGAHLERRREVIERNRGGRKNSLEESELLHEEELYALAREESVDFVSRMSGRSKPAVKRLRDLFLGEHYLIYPRPEIIDEEAEMAKIDSFLEGNPEWAAKLPKFHREKKK